MDEIHDDGTELDVYHMDIPDGSWVHLDMDPSLRSKTARLRTGQQVVAEVASLPTQTTSVPSLFDSAFSVASLPRANPLTPGTSLQVMDIGPANAALSTSSVAARRLMARLTQAPPPSPSPAYTSPFPEYSNFFPRVLIVIIQNCDSVVARPIDMMDVFMEPTMGVAGYLNACSNGKVSLARKNVTAVAVSGPMRGATLRQHLVQSVQNCQLVWAAWVLQPQRTPAHSIVMAVSIICYPLQLHQLTTAPVWSP